MLPKHATRVRVPVHAVTFFVFLYHNLYVYYFYVYGFFPLQPIRISCQHCIKYSPIIQTPCAQSYLNYRTASHRRKRRTNTHGKFLIFSFFLLMILPRGSKNTILDSFYLIASRPSPNAPETGHGSNYRHGSRATWTLHPSHGSAVTATG